MDIKIEVKEKISKSEIDEMKKFSDDNWGEDDHGFTPKEVKNSFFDKPKIVVTTSLNNNLVGLVFVHPRKIIFNNRAIKFAGMGGMVVGENYRRRGIATMILKKAFSQIQKRNIDIAMLCTDIEKLGKLYDKVGFVPLGRPYYFIQKDGKEGVENGGMIAKVCSQEIFDMVINSKEKLNVGVSNF